MSRFSSPMKIQLAILASFFYLGSLAAQHITTYSGGQVNTTAVANRIATQLPAAPDLANAWFLVEKLPTQTVGGNAIRARVYSINNLDQVMGINYIGGTTPTIWSASGAHPSGVSDYTQELSSAKKLNDFARFVANKTGPSAQGGVFTFSELGGVVIEQTMPGITLHGINNYGWMLAVEPEQPGYSYNFKSYYGRHFILKGTGEVNIAVPRDAENGAYLEGINIAGQVVGGASPQYGYVGARGFFAEADGRFRWLTSNNNFDEAYGVNDSGQIVGTTSLPDYSSVPALWENGRGAGIESLPTVRLAGGFENAWASAINKWGQVVGRTRAGIALWLNKRQLDFTGRLINPENLKLISLLDINDRGVMLGEQNYTQGGITYSDNFILRPIWPQLAVDANRDGQIDLRTNGTIGSEDDSDVTSADNPYRFWINDDDDWGDIQGDDIPGQNESFSGGYIGGEADYSIAGDGTGRVDGVRDLVDFFPVFFDFKALLTVLPPSDSIKYKLKQADGALNFVYTNQTVTHAFDYQKQSLTTGFGDQFNEEPGSAATHRITAQGVELSSAFLVGAMDNDWGVILVEGRAATTQPLVLSVEKDGTQITEIKLHLRVSSVEAMYRWLNLRDVAGQTMTRATDAAEPANWPDSEANGKMFVMVHGYNVNEDQSRGWGAEIFKRLYWSGSAAMFTMVSWHGDHSQIPLIGISPDYWQNINYAFMTAQALPAAINNLPGSSKVIAGHSMGNMVVSSAIVDHGLSVSHYFMLNAAVALEAYDTTAMSSDAMRHPDWATYATRLWPTEWFDLFPTGDGRRGLTWRERFGNIANATNFYSSGEDVLNNNDATPGQVPSVGGERAWVLQEMVKGTNHIGAVLTFDVQGGWGFNASWDMPTFVPDDSDAGGYYVYNRRTPAQASALTDDQLHVQTFFLPFQDTRFVSATAGSAAAVEYLPRADALGGAIPALSFATGRNPVPLFDLQDRNVDLMNRQDGWPQARLDNETLRNRWLHSDAKNIAYRYNHKLWEDWVDRGDLR